MRDGDLQELYQLLRLYGRTYGGDAADGLMQEVEARCRERGVRPDAGNVRGAGRKRKFDSKKDAEILEAYAQGGTIRQIAEQKGCSTGYVHKLIKTQKMRSQIN